jgi:uncharacterized protein YcnI
MKLLRIVVVSCLLLVVSLAWTLTASAHVVVKPSEVGIAAFQTFTVGVPNEKDTPTVAMRLLIPNGVKSVSPNVKPGWMIDVKSAGQGEDVQVTEIDWTGGNIPPGQRDEFLFSAQAPSSETTISWKAYQTYADGTVVSWDVAPNSKVSDEEKEKMEQAGTGPLSQTKVINDLKQPPQNDSGQQSSTAKQTADFSLLLSIAALAIAVVSFIKGANRK